MSSHSAGSIDLSRIPTRSILRSVLFGVIFTRPYLLKWTMPLFQRMSRTDSKLLHPDSNLLVKAMIKPIFYDQFCAGTTQREVARTRNDIRAIGYSGIVLCLGREAHVGVSGSLDLTMHRNRDVEIDNWRDGNLETLNMVESGDLVGIKLTGAGQAVTQALLQNEAPPQRFVEAMQAICAKAQERKCKIWIDAEQQCVQPGIDSVTIDLMREFNRGGSVVVYNTVQAYLKAARSNLQHQLSLARAEGWTLAVKLVRGAYIAHDQRDKIHDTKADTDRCYDSLVRDLLCGSNLGVGEHDFPTTRLLIAGHNPSSVMGAAGLATALAREGRLKSTPDFAQLQGMADALGCELLQYFEQAGVRESARWAGDQAPRVYKCLTWGSMQECMQYLLRRMIENSGASETMRDSLALYTAELRRRMFGFWRA